MIPLPPAASLGSEYDEVKYITTEVDVKGV